mmetsp:Transcript_8912/g.9848  ORF Transcript_8912/g.9848 Transcript_8912/m.9848 type:complete len:645 (-) Transcript_8912:156-2090(-)
MVNMNNNSNSKRKSKSKSKKENSKGGKKGDSQRSNRTNASLSSNTSVMTRQVSNVSAEGRERAASIVSRSRTSSSGSSDGETNILVVDTNMSANMITDLDTPIPLRQRSRSQPVDLDDMVDTMADNNNVQHDSVSPTGTFDTVPLSHTRSFQSYSSESPTTQNDSNYLPVSLMNFDSSTANRNNNNTRSNNNNDNNSNNSNKVVIEHKMKNSSNNNTKGISSGVGSLFCILKSLLPFLLIMAVVGSAASIYGWIFKFPTLSQEVKALEEQVVRLNTEIDRMTTEIDRLGLENDRYASLNTRLNVTVDELEDVQDDLNSTVYELEDVAARLNLTKDELTQEINTLYDRNREYEVLNIGLAQNVDVLSQEISYFQEALTRLTEEHSTLLNTTVSLENLVIQFENTTMDQNETMQILKETLEGFTQENDRLETFNNDLLDGLQYLNTTLTEGLDTSLEEITLVLGEQVQQQQYMTLKQLEISYRQVIQNWDCTYGTVFSNEEYGQDYDLPLTDNNILPQTVNSYVEERVLSKLCLNSYDFADYLNKNYNGLITSNQLIRSTVLYTNAALQYYFPTATNNDDTTESSESMIAFSGDDDEGKNGGMPLTEWIQAGFRCELLSTPFVWNDENDNDNNNLNVRLRVRRRHT